MYFEDDFQDEEEPRKLPLRELYRGMRPLAAPHVPAFALAAALLLVAVGGELCGPLILRRIIDVAIPAGSVSQTVLLALLFAAVFGVTMALSYMQVMVATKLGLAIVRDLKEKVFAHMLTLSQSFFDAFPSGKLMARVESDSERVRMLFSEVGMAILRSISMMVGTLTIMAVTDLKITLSVLALVTPIALLIVPVLKYMRKLWGKVRASYSRIAGLVSEYVRSVPVLQVFAAEKVARDRLSGEGRRFLRLEVRASLWEYGFWGFLGSCELAAVAIILSAGRGGVVAGAITVGTVVLFVEYTRRLFAPIVQFSETLSQIQRALASSDRIFGILNTRTLTPDGDCGEEDFPQDWKEIRFEKVWFRYGEEWALRGVSFTVSRGAVIALVGASGGGKSTIVSLLMRFYEPQEGRITIDGNDIRSFRLDVWRRRLGLVLQNVSLFSGTLGENITVFDPSYGEAEQEEALRTVEADDLMDRDSEGLAAEISEGGLNLSMGERQLVSFARAVLRKPDILVLDEATSSVDPGTERRIQKALGSMLKGRTALIVAHRLSTILGADTILVISGGGIVEQGSHSELLEQDGIYAGLFRLQFGLEEARA
jgi:ATP-binding cassette subfamily B multidrug efflux pump